MIKTKIYFFRIRFGITTKRLNLMICLGEQNKYIFADKYRISHLVMTNNDSICLNFKINRIRDKFFRFLFDLFEPNLCLIETNIYLSINHKIFGLSQKSRNFFSGLISRK